MINQFKNTIIDNALLKKSRICLPEINDCRVVEASHELRKLGFNIVDGQDLANNTHDYSKLIKRKKFAQNWTGEMIADYMNNPLNLSISALDSGDLDCVVAGALHKTSDVIRSAIRIVGINKNKKWITSVFFMLSPCYKYLYTYADCAVIPEPNAEQLCYIGYEASKLHKLVSGNDSKIAFLSFSTKGSAEHYKVKKIQEATSLFSKKFGHIEYEGELQFDAAINESVAINKIKNSQLKGHANTFIFPDLDSGNISYKITERLANYQAIGPVLVGLNKTVNDLSRGCSVDDIILTTAISALQS